MGWVFPQQIASSSSSSSSSSSTGSSSSSLPPKSVKGVLYFHPLQTIIIDSFLLPATGSIETLLVETSTGFEVGDTVSLITRPDSQATDKLAVFEIISITSNAIEVKVLARPDNPYVSAEGTEFPSGSEVTGQTRLPEAPPGASQATLYCSQSPALAWARHNPSDPARDLAIILYEEYAPLSYTFKYEGSADIDSVEIIGIPFGTDQSVELQSLDFGLFRLFCEMPIRFRPHIKVIYR